MTAAIKIEVFAASTCNRCTQAKQHIQRLVDEFNEGVIDYREVDVLDELDYAVSLCILTTPAIAIDGALVFTTMPSLQRLRDELNKRLTVT